MSPAIEKIRFRECSVCAAKPGAPTLCQSCLNNRGLESRLYRSVENEEKAKAELDRVLEERDRLLEENERLELELENLRDRRAKWMRALSVSLARLATEEPEL